MKVVCIDDQQQVTFKLNVHSLTQMLTLSINAVKQDLLDAQNFQAKHRNNAATFREAGQQAGFINDHLQELLQARRDLGYAGKD